MQTRPEIALWLVQERREREIKAAREARMIAGLQRSSSRRTIRRALGRSIIRIGARLAAESTFEPARSR